MLIDIDDIRIKFVNSIPPHPRVEFKTPYGWVHINDLGLGYRTAIAWMVDLLRLNRKSLQKSRLTCLQRMKLYYEAIQAAQEYPHDLKLQGVVAQATQLLENATKPDSEFSSAIRPAIETQFQYVSD